MAILKAVLEALPAGFVHLLIRGFSTAIAAMPRSTASS